jgi:hypothetical protein
LRMALSSLDLTACRLNATARIVLRPFTARRFHAIVAHACKEPPRRFEKLAEIAGGPLRREMGRPTTA